MASNESNIKDTVREQAEAMARDMYHGNTIEQTIAALSKLIAENERSKEMNERQSKEIDIISEDRDKALEWVDDLKSQLTALSKLIAENERLKKESNDWMQHVMMYRLHEQVPMYPTCDCPSCRLNIFRNNLQSQLTATEAKLKEAMHIVELATQGECDCSGSLDSGSPGFMHAPNCASIVAMFARTFLSTLTAEKKESE